MIIVTVTVFVGAQAAFAHAALEWSTPVDGQALAESPPAVELGFTEAVDVDADGVVIVDQDGDTVPTPAPTVDGATVRLALPDALPDGVYVVVWQVTSADGHPVRGSVRFGVGVGAAEVDGVDAAGPDDPAMIDPLGWAARMVGMAGLLVAVGVVVFSDVVQPLARARENLGRWRRGAALAGVAGAVSALAVHVADVGGSWSAVMERDGWADGLVEGHGAAALVGSSALVVVAWGRGAALVGMVAALVAAISPAFAGHTRVADPELVGVASDMVHVLAAAIWAGGLVALAVTLRPDASPGPADEDDAEAIGPARRFSRVAAGALVAVVLTGVVSASVIDGSLTSLSDTRHGQLVVAKLGVVLAAAAVGGLNRWVVLPRVGPAVAVRAWLRRTVRVEVAALVVVVGFSAALVESPPDGDGGRAPVAVAGASIGEAEIGVRIEPARTGTSRMVVTAVASDGSPFDGFAELVVRWSMPALGVDGDRVTPDRRAPGVLEADDVSFPVAGRWTGEVFARDAAGTTVSATVEVEIGR